MTEKSKKRYHTRKEYSGLYKFEVNNLFSCLDGVEEINCLYCGAYIEDPDAFHKCPNCSKINMLFVGDDVFSQVIVPTRADLTFMLQAHHDLKDVEEGLKAFTVAMKSGFI